jgi:hypothetical protein
MTRSSNSSAKKRREKRKQANSTNSPDQRIDDGELHEDGVDTMLTPTRSAAPAASPPSPADMSSMKVSQPIAKREPTSDEKRITPSTSPDGVQPNTPIQNTNNHTEVTFKSDPIATSISSRRQRSRKSKLGRTSRALSRDEQLMINWEEEQYDITFKCAKPGADPIARIAITLASGQRVKPGEALAPDLIDRYLSQLREDLTHEQREKILRPPPSRKSHRRRREAHSDSGGSDEDYVSLLSETSERHSEVSSKHSG